MSARILHAPRFTVDLRDPPSDRWRAVLGNARMRRLARRLVAEARAWALSQVPAWKRPLLKAFAYGLVRPFVAHRTHRTEYGAEMRAWTRCAGEDTPLANMSYELSGLFGGMCSSVAFWLAGKGMVHARNLDWPLYGIRKATILVDFVNAPAGPFTAVTMPGFVGVLSGVAPGRFSITVNMPQANTPREHRRATGWSVAWLLRDVFEECRTYGSALRRLKAAATVYPCLVQIAGCRKGEAAIVEVNPWSPNRHHPYARRPLAITNHYLDDEGYLGKEDEKDTGRRRAVITARASAFRGKAVPDALSILSRPPVKADDTVQSMVFCAATGEVYLRRC